MKGYLEDVQQQPELNLGHAAFDLGDISFKSSKSLVELSMFYSSHSRERDKIESDCPVRGFVLDEIVPPLALGRDSSRPPSRGLKRTPQRMFTQR